MRFAAYGTDDQEEITGLVQKGLISMMAIALVYRLKLKEENWRSKTNLMKEVSTSSCQKSIFPQLTFTFKSDIEQLHLQKNPRELLPDLIRNKFLEESALVMVKNVDDIEEIWRRLKEAFGDPKIMMIKKFAELNPAKSLLHSRDPEIVSTGLSKVINTMKESLTKKHMIEKRLYHGDGNEADIQSSG